jgi:hypothetical protein
MKVRTDFITNSSSSAFVIIGARLKDSTIDYNEMYKILNEKNLRYFGEENTLGRVLSDGITIDYSSLEGIFTEVEDIFAELDIDEEVCLIADMFFT